MNPTARGGSNSSIDNMLTSIAEQHAVAAVGRSSSSAPDAAADNSTFDRSLLEQPVKLSPSSYSAMTSSLMRRETAPLVTPVYKKRVVGVEIASVFAQPSMHLQQQVLRNNSCLSFDTYSNSHNKRQRVIQSAVQPLDSNRPQNQDDLLHQACCQPNVSVETISQLLSSDPMAASRAMTVRMETSNGPACNNAESSAAPPAPAYTYPINLAIQHHAKPEILALLIHAAPQVLSQPDGPHCETSLHVLVQYYPHHTATLLLVLLTQPALASRADARGRYPLQVAQQQGHAVSDDVIQYLSLVYPEAASNGSSS